MTSPAVSEPVCPKCGGQMWNNTMSKTNPKAPDFKCRDRSCDGVIWPERGGQRRGPTGAAPQRNTPQPISAGPALPYEQDTTQATPIDSFAGMVQLYKRCVSEAQSIASQNAIDRLGGDVAGAVSAMAATLFIGAKDRGIR